MPGRSIRTKDMPFAAYLLCEGFTLLRVEHEGLKQRFWVFASAEDETVEQLLLSWSASPEREYWDAVSRIKDTLGQKRGD